MTSDDFAVAIDGLARILGGQIGNFADLDAALPAIGKKQTQLAVISVFENFLGYPQNSVEALLRILQDISPVKTGSDGAQLQQYAICLICLSMLQLPTEPHQSLRAELAKKLCGLLPPLHPDVVPVRFVPHQNSLQALLSSTQKRIEQSLHRLSAKDKESSFLSFIAGTNAVRSSLDVLTRQFSSQLDFECEEVEGYQKCDEVNIVIRSKNGEDGRYNCGLLLVPFDMALSSALSKKMEDKFLAQLLPSAQLDIVFYLSPPAGSREVAWPALKQLLQLCPEGLGGYVTNNYHVFFAEHVIESLAQTLQAKIRDKQTAYFYANIGQRPGRREDILILKAGQEFQAIPFFQFGHDQGKVHFLEQEAFWSTLKSFYIHGMHLALAQEEMIANIYRRLLPFKKS